MIEIYKTIIDEKEVIGCGPLMLKVPGDELRRLAHRQRSYYFEVYCKGFSFIVSTDWLCDIGGSETTNLEHERAALFEAYKALRKLLIEGTLSELLIFKTE